MLFIENGSAFAMAGIDLGVVRQVEQPFLDTLTERFVATPGEVGAANAAAEERVAREDPAFNFSIKANAAHGVTWCADNLQSALTHLDDFTILQVAVGKPTLAVKRHAEELRLLLRTQELALHIEMGRHWDAITFFDSRIAKDMVNMTMCVDDHQRFEAVAVNEAKEFVLLARSGAAWVDDDTFLGVAVINDVCVFRKGIADKRFDLKHNDVFRGKGRDFSAAI